MLSKDEAFGSADAEKGHPLEDYKYFVRYLKRHNII